MPRRHIGLLLAGLLLPATLFAQGHGWRSPLDATDNAIAAGDGLLFASGKDGSVVAFAPETGERRWSFQVGDATSAGVVVTGQQGLEQAMATGQAAAGRRIMLQAPAWHSLLVYVGSGHAQPAGVPNFHALDAASGTPHWSYFAVGGVERPAVPSGELVIVVGKRTVYALEAATGAERWRFEPLAGLHDAARRPASAPVIDGSKLYVTAWPFRQFGAPYASYLFALDTATGERRWTVEVEGGDASQPVVHGDVVYFAVAGPRLFAVDTDSGAIRWEAKLGSTASVGNLVARADGIYVDSPWDDHVLAVDPESGRLRWQADSGRVLHSPGEVLYVERSGAVDVLDPATGRAQRSIRIRRDGYVQWLDAGLMLVSAGNRLAAYDPAAGKQRWERRLDSNIGTVLVDHGVLIVVTLGEDLVGRKPKPGHVYRLDVATGQGG